MSELFVAMLGKNVWFDYCEMYRSHKAAEPAIPNQGIFVQNEYGALVGGVCVYTTDGPWMLLENLIVRSDLSPPAAHRVITFMVAVAAGAGAVQAKMPLVMSSIPTVGAILERAGFVKTPVTAVYTLLPGQRPTPEESPPPEGDKDSDDERVAEQEKRTERDELVALGFEREDKPAPEERVKKERTPKQLAADKRMRGKKKPRKKK